jgi:hypothetical protein
MKGELKMLSYSITTTQEIINKAKTAGDRGEWSLAHYYGISRTKHDSKRFDQDSDLNVGNKHISVKVARFSLIAGCLTKDCTTFDEIWLFYESKVHSNCFAYITKDLTVYEMNLDEFKAFVYLFCGLERESKKNGGYLKIKARSESKKMLNWLAAQVAA